MNVRRTVIVAALVTAAALLAGCSGTATTSAETAPRPNAPLSADNSATGSDTRTDDPNEDIGFGDGGTKPLDTSDAVTRAAVLAMIPEAFEDEWALMNDNQREATCNDWSLYPEVLTSEYFKGLTSAGSSESDFAELGVTREDFEREIVAWMDATCGTNSTAFGDSSASGQLTLDIIEATLDRQWAESTQSERSDICTGWNMDPSAMLDAFMNGFLSEASATDMQSAGISEFDVENLVIDWMDTTCGSSGTSF